MESFTTIMLKYEYHNNHAIMEKYEYHNKILVYQTLSCVLY